MGLMDETVAMLQQQDDCKDRGERPRPPACPSCRYLATKSPVLAPNTLALDSATQ
jgi:hypothetical protein